MTFGLRHSIIRGKDQPPPSRKSFRRFPLRELLLLMVSVGAVDAELAKEKCDIVFRATIGPDDSPHGFIVRYRKHPTDGSFCMHTAAEGTEAIAVQVVRMESRN